MKVNDIYSLAKSFMFEKPSSSIYNDYIIPICNKVLAELYEENNMCRMFYGKLPLVDGIEQHIVKSLDDDLDALGWEFEYQLDVIPKGIATYFLMDDDMSKMSQLQTEYSNARVLKQKMVDLETIKELEELANAS